MPGVSGTAVEIPLAVLARMLRLVKPCMSSDPDRPHIHGAQIEVADSKLKLITTDGHRLAMAEQPCDGKATWSALISYTAVEKLQASVKMLAKEKFPYAVRLNREGAVVTALVLPTTAGVSLSFPVVGADFPPYAQVFPDGEPKATVGLDPKYFAECMGVFSKTEPVQIEVRGELDPVVFRREEDGFACIIMPCRP